MSLEIVLAAVLFAWLLVLGLFARRLHADWREPVLAVPVIVVESDDWGPGPPADGTVLRRLTAVLRKYRDANGRRPVVTLGVVLAVPGAEVRSGQHVPPAYAPSMLDNGRYTDILDAMREGRADGVFALQLHGFEHFWPAALLKAAQRVPVARAFLQGAPDVPRHEMLPSHLQARWVDAAQLPSVELSREEIERAVAEETACYQRVFGMQARVVVPVTFTWTTDVEAAWATHGIRVVVTPGSRNIGRDAEGRLIADGSMLRNGDRAPGGMVYVVRDVYFEPVLGHTAERALQEIRERHRLGRPALLEMHRFNFTGDQAQTDRSLGELDRLLAGALATIPKLHFMSTEDLAGALLARNPALVDRRLAARLRAFLLRASTQHRLRRLAWISGLAVPAIAAFWAASVLLARTGRVRSMG